MTGKETGKHRKIFECWYASERNVQKTAESCSVAERTLWSWIERYAWNERAARRDEEAARLAEQEAIQRRRQELEAHNRAVGTMKARHIQIATDMQEKLVQRLQSLDVNKLTPRELASWFEVSTKVERLARGEVTEITDERVEIGKSLDRMSEAELEAYINQREGELGLPLTNWHKQHALLARQNPAPLSLVG